jgi:hypothetical protein
MAGGYPWYGTVHDSSLEQGDLLAGCPVIEPYWDAEINHLSPAYRVQARQRIYDVVILTQSCDLVNDKVDTILVCAIYSVDLFAVFAVSVKLFL